MIRLDARPPAQQERMDDLSAGGAELEQALEELRWVNRWLGGYAATWRVLRPLLRRRQTLRLLDVGTGAPDVPEDLVRRGANRRKDLQVTALDANPAVAAHARRALDTRLPPPLRRRIEVVEGDPRALPYADSSFDVAIAAFCLHHFDGAEAVQVLREMDRVARRGILVNDLHRHVIAYHSIRVIGALLDASPMFRHDGPLSVRRGFRRDELQALAQTAGLPGARIRWHWAFRWTLSTV